MRCKIKAPSEATYLHILTLLPKWHGHFLMNKARLLIAAELTEGSAFLELLELGAIISKDQRFDLD